MPVDNTLPPSRLPAYPASEQIVRHFPATFGVQVDLSGLDALPVQERLTLLGARLPEPPEAVLLDRILELVPAGMLPAIGRIVMLDSLAVGRLGTLHWE